MLENSFAVVDPSWQPILEKALETMSPDYLEQLEKHASWLPGKDSIFRAFSLPLSNTRYILFGESPYPRKVSANGYAFWDGNVKELWSNSGFSKEVNKATSLRNFIKMLLVSEKLLHSNDTSQEAISKLDKSIFVSSIDELFNHMLKHGFLLLNASLVLSQERVHIDAKAWQPFMYSLLSQLAHAHPEIKLILLGNIAKEIKKIPASQKFELFEAEHPYNISFIQNENVQKFFLPFHLLKKNSKH